MKAVVDRIESDRAVVLFGDEETAVAIPLALLPEGTREGSILKVSFEPDPSGTEAQKEKISNLLAKLKKKSSN